MGTWHRISAKHLAAYLDEMTFRFNRRKNANLFLDTLPYGCDPRYSPSNAEKPDSLTIDLMAKFSLDRTA